MTGGDLGPEGSVISLTTLMLAMIPWFDCPTCGILPTSLNGVLDNGKIFKDTSENASGTSGRSVGGFVYIITFMVVP